MLLPEINFLAIAIAALVPNLFGALYFGPLLGKQWLLSLDKTRIEMEPTNATFTYILAFCFSFIIAFFLNYMLQMVHKDVNAAGELILASEQTFRHGAFHGTLISLSIAAPVIGCLGLFHKLSIKTIMINILFWVICFATMGGIVDAWH